MLSFVCVCTVANLWLIKKQLALSKKNMTKVENFICVSKNVSSVAHLLVVIKLSILKLGLKLEEKKQLIYCRP